MSLVNIKLIWLFITPHTCINKDALHRTAMYRWQGLRSAGSSLSCTFRREKGRETSVNSKPVTY